MYGGSIEDVSTKQLFVKQFNGLIIGIFISMQMSSQFGPQMTNIEDVSSTNPSISSMASESTIDGRTLKRKAIKPRSIVWDHFTKFVDQNGEAKARCNYCDKVFAAHPMKNGTTTLRGHIAICKKHPHSVETSQTQLNLHSNVQGGNILSTWKFDQIASRNALAYMIIVDELPFKFVEGLGFEKFISVIQPRFKIPSRFTVSRDCYELFLSERVKLKQFLKTTSQRVCLTTDTWTSIQRINYMCLTTHFIDDDWNVHKKILNFCPVDSHKGKDLGIAIEKCLLDWEIEKVFTVTVDNASSNDVAIRHLRNAINNWGHSVLDGEFLHMRCMAHILNLVVVDGLKHVNPSIIRVRAAVRYVRQSPARLKKFRECVDIEKIESKSLLTLDVATRWNSTYLMLEAAQKFERAFNRYEEIDPLYRSELDVDHGDGVLGLPNVDDWRVCRKMVSMLKIFYDLTLLVSGSSYVTSNSYFEEICSVEYVLKQWKESSDSEEFLMASRMKEKFDKYWGDVRKMNKLIYFATILDPRHKIAFVQFSFIRLYGNSDGELMTNIVRESVYAMYDSYCKLAKPQGKFGQSSESGSERMEVSNANDERIEKGTKSKKLEAKLLFKKFRSDIGSGENKSELDRYLNEDVENDDDDDFNILAWWKNNSPRFPILSQLARDVLAVPISTVASESAFSTGGRYLDAFRSSLSPNIVQSLICAQDWLRNSLIPINIEEDLQDIEKIEAGNFIYSIFYLVIFYF